MAKKSKRSTGAVAKAWGVFNKQPKAERKDVIAACEKAGINSFTAKTQYQHWLHASPKQRAEKVNGNGGGKKKEGKKQTAVATAQ